MPLGRLTAPVVRRRDEVPGSGEDIMVVSRLSRGDGGHALAERRLRIPGLGIQLRRRELDPREPLHVSVTCRGRQRRRLLEHRTRAFDLAACV